MDTIGVTEYQHFSTKYIWTYREKKDGSGVSERKRYKRGDYYRLYSDTICRGFDAKGRMVYIGNEYLGCLDQACLSHITEIDTIMEAIGQDLAARGRDFDKYGCIQWVEQVGDHYVLAVIYDPPVSADFLWAFYTFDRNGRMEGVTLYQR